MFDYNEFKRFNIALNKLPKESRVVNLPESFFVKYRKTLTMITFIFISLSLIIVIFTIDISKRKKLKKN